MLGTSAGCGSSSPQAAAPAPAPAAEEQKAEPESNAPKPDETKPDETKPDENKNPCADDGKGEGANKGTENPCARPRGKDDGFGPRGRGFILA